MGNRGLVIVLVVLVAVFLIGPLIGGGMMGPGMMWGYGPQGGASGSRWVWALAMGLGSLSMLAFWGALIVGVVLLVRWLGGTAAGRDSGEDPALETLRRRYAAGEISREEYEERRKVLER